MTLVGIFGQLVRDARDLLGLIAAEALLLPGRRHRADDLEHAHLDRERGGVGGGRDLAAHAVDHLGHRHRAGRHLHLDDVAVVREELVDGLLDVGRQLRHHRERPADRRGGRRLGELQRGRGGRVAREHAGDRGVPGAPLQREQRGRRGRRRRVRARLLRLDGLVRPALMTPRHPRDCDRPGPVAPGADGQSSAQPAPPIFGRRHHCRDARERGYSRPMAGLFDVLPRTAATADDGRLSVGGCALADVAAEFGTPAFVIDEQGLRDTAREYLGAFGARHPGTTSTSPPRRCRARRSLRVLAEEGLGCDVASAGELAIALAAGFDPAEILLHGNAKSDEDIGAALDAGVGRDRHRRARRRRPARAPRAGAPGACSLRINPAVPGRHARGDGHRQPGGEVRRGARRRAGAAGPDRRDPGPAAARAARPHRLAAARPRRLRPRRRRRSPRSAASRSTTSAAGSGSRTAGGRAPSVADYAEATVGALHTTSTRRPS